VPIVGLHRSHERSARSSRGRVLLTVDAGTGSLAAVRGLRAGGYEPWAAGWRRDTYAAFSRATAGRLAVPDPELDPEGHASELARAAHSVAARVVLPGTDTSLLALLGREGRFGDTAVATGSATVVRRLRSPDELARVAARHGLSAAPRPVDELLAPSSGRRGSTRGTPAAELRSISGLVWEGALISALHHRSPRVRLTRNGRSAYAETLSPDPELETAMAGVLEDVGWSGLYHAPLVVSEGETWLLELVVTPGLYGSLALAQAAGHNLTAAWADRVLGESPQLGAYRVGVGLRIEEADYPTLAMHALAGHPLAALRDLRAGPGLHHAVLALRDPAPAVVMAYGVYRAGLRAAVARRARHRR
jgi:hypothetical protein